ncbi:MAG: phosphoribosylglycinamide formyltransferase [Clostridia bacterium]|nr:phosphoribosylglycinamide formyltransferase [Clostridia bacterium]
MLNTAVLVSGGGTNLQAIIDSKARGEMPSVALKLVLSSNRGAFALTRAENAGIPTAVVAKRKSETEEEYGCKLLNVLREHGIELIALAGFLTILPENVVREYDHRILNIHPSLIPAFCGKGYYGLKVHEEALKRGVKISGATVHFVNEIPDGGDIIAQKAVEVLPDDTPETLQKRIMVEAEWKLLPAALEQTAANLRKEKE